MIKSLAHRVDAFGWFGSIVLEERFGVGLRR
jgi:hypothetical protein